MESRDYSVNPTTPELVSSSKKKRNKMEKKRRFSDEQIKLLESIFESDSKLEPRKKLQLARELDLQPRQVAIWFQNRRARWKSKQIEKEFRKLKSDYDSLASKFESLMAEKQSLLLELQKLNDHKGTLEVKCNKERATSNENNNYEAKPNSEEELEPRSGLMKPENNMTINTIEDPYGDQEGYHQILNTTQQVEAPSLAPLENLYNFDPSVFLDQSRVPPQWLNYWT